MALDLQPAYHTETMVKILRDQGAVGLAMELAESMLQSMEEFPKRISVEKLLYEMKEEKRISFERFRQAGLEKLKQNQEEQEELEQERDKVVPLRPQASVVEPSKNNSQAEKLKSLLQRVQAYRAREGEKS